MTAKRTSADVIVVGGGIIGMAISYYAAKQGMDVLLLERGELGGGTSSRCDGNILAIDKDPGFDSRMSLQSQLLVRDLARELDEPFEYRAPGSILVCENDAEMEAAGQWVDRQRAAGLSFRLLDRGDLRGEWRHMADDLPGGLECATDSTVNPVHLTYALAATARRLGARFAEHTSVVSLMTDPRQGIRGVETDGGPIYAPKVVVAAGIWSKAIARTAGVEIPVEPRKGHILVSSRTANIGLRKVMEFGYLMSKFGSRRQVDAAAERYGVAFVFEPTASQNFLIGSSRQFVGFDLRVDPQVVRQIARRAIRFFPAMRDVPVIRTYAGLRPWTPDHLPIVSEVEEVPGLLIAAGHEGDGISLAAVTGKLVAELLGGSPTCLPIEPLRYDRFKNAVPAHP